MSINVRIFDLPAFAGTLDGSYIMELSDAAAASPSTKVTLNQIGSFLSSGSLWSRTGTDTYLANATDRLGIGATVSSFLPNYTQLKAVFQANTGEGSRILLNGTPGTEQTILMDDGSSGIKAGAIIYNPDTTTMTFNIAGSIIMSWNQNSLKLNDGSLIFAQPASNVYTGILEPITFTGNRIWSLPNQSGTIALLSNIAFTHNVTDTYMSNASDILGIGAIGSSYVNYTDLKAVIQANTGKDCRVLLNCDPGYECILFMDDHAGVGQVEGAIAYKSSTGVGRLISTDIDALRWDSTLVTLPNNALVFKELNFSGNLSATTLTAARNWTLPDASGMISLVSNVTSAISNAFAYVAVPVTSSSSGTQGQRSFDGSYIYDCVATNTWVKHIVITSF